MQKTNICIIPTDATIGRAQTLSDALDLPLLLEPPKPEITHALLLTEQGLSLQCLQPTRMTPIQADFCSSRLKKRFQPQAWRQELIARACGFKQNKTPHILDATGGFGEDAFALASLGAKVSILERSPIMHALLEDALTRANDASIDAEKRMHLFHEDAHRYLTESTHEYDVIYLDPMYPDPDKRALVKKKCRAIRDLVGNDFDADTLLALAMHRAPRVVVKRPRLAPSLANKEADQVLLGKAIRFDIYLNPKENTP